ncbi:2258_t:CDS:2, partial [Gigaspora margarita]
LTGAGNIGSSNQRAAAFAAQDYVIQSGAILTAVVSGARKEEPKCHELVLSL